jgi:hypothetical protein
MADLINTTKFDFVPRYKIEFCFTLHIQSRLVSKKLANIKNLHDTPILDNFIIYENFKFMAVIINLIMNLFFIWPVLKLKITN